MRIAVIADIHVNLPALEAVLVVMPIARKHQVSADMLAIPYDWDAASAQAENNDRPEWAYGLRTGWLFAGR